MSDPPPGGEPPIIILPPSAQMLLWTVYNIASRPFNRFGQQAITEYGLVAQVHDMVLVAVLGTLGITTEFQGGDSNLRFLRFLRLFHSFSTQSTSMRIKIIYVFHVEALIVTLDSPNQGALNRAFGTQGTARKQACSKTALKRQRLSNNCSYLERNSRQVFDVNANPSLL